MVRTEFNDREAETIREALESYLSELNSEIFTTDTLSFRHADELTQKKAMVVDMIGKMEERVA